MKKILLLIPLLLMTLNTQLQAEAAQYDDKVIKNIVIEAEDMPSDSGDQTRTVERKLRTKVGERFIQTVFDQDLKTLAKEYDRVDPKIKVHQDEVYITLKVWHRPLITEIDFSGNYQFNPNKLRKELGIESHTLFNRQAFIQGLHKLREYYMKKGYFEAELDYKLKKDPNKNQVAIEISVESGRSGFIQHVDFVGFSKEEVTKLKESLHTTKYYPFISWVTRKGIYNEEAIQHDQIKILEFLRDEGYANAKIEIAVTEVEASDRVGIVITADKGDLFTIGKVSFAGNKEFQSEEIEKKLLVTENKPYSPKKIQDAANAITEFYGKKGYIDASVAYEPHLIPGENAYDVHFKIEEGAAYKVGLIKIIGNNRTFPKVILREANLEPGNTFDTKMLEVTRKRLENIGYYEHVNVYPSATSSAQSIKAPLRDVNIMLKETSTGSFGLNMGYSTVGSVYGGLELSEKNFNLAGIFDIPAKGIGALRGGGEFIKIQSNIGVKITDYSLNWMKPYFLDTLWSIGVNLDKNLSKVQSESYQIDTFTATFNTFYPLNIFVNLNAFYRLRDTKLNARAGAPLSIRDQANSNGIISSVGLGLQYETRNSMHRPTQGVSSSLVAEYAGVGGDFYYFSYGYLNSIYVPVGPFILKTKANFKFIQPITSRTTADQIPVGERFFLATDISEVRGYGPFAIGPQFKSADSDGNKITEPKGGITEVILSEELVYGLIPKFLDVFAFVDAGTLTGDPFKIDTFRVSTGVGARVVAAPNLPLMVGWGYPINPTKEQRAQRGQRFFLSLGGRF